METTNQLQASLNLEIFLDKMASLDRFLESSSGMTVENRENIGWYCNHMVHQYYECYVAQNPPCVVESEKQRSGAGRKRHSKRLSAGFDT